ncbi:adenylyl-sulfate kinase [Comamonas endophytica]|uniref:Adenylyl-sulfate kinase n=1 Tax=Comamonas endophytica TaxID=2949090 RepID=A0ABY6GF77_9BURK|nr:MULTISPECIES: adenylyl-sulfate kinase [unclassified Acidovorax]MCD2513137.1 adenylyl-sulfate kinase [Acidovorax sp. D4N7]UYG53513.1 adenylyl-sulfate kinase [Acidovorax sp. 5MLIR]
MANATNVVPQAGQVARSQREQLLGQRGRVIWFTGLSGSGKSTLAYALEARLHAAGRHCVVLDGDNLRHGLCADLGFSPADRHENLRRAAQVARLFAESGTICLAAFISPMRADREMVRQIVGPQDLYEVYLDCPLEACEARDVKQLYQRARAGAIADFTGVSAPYEPPLAPQLVLATQSQSIEECLQLLVELSAG